MLNFLSYSGLVMDAKLSLLFRFRVSSSAIGHADALRGTTLQDKGAQCVHISIISVTMAVVFGIVWLLLLLSLVL